MTIVGICSDVKSYRLDEPDSRTVYLPYAQRSAAWQRFGDLVVRAKGDPAALVTAVRQAVLSVDKTLPLAGVTTLEARRAELAAQPRFNAFALAAFAALAVLPGPAGPLRHPGLHRWRSAGGRSACAWPWGRKPGTSCASWWAWAWA